MSISTMEALTALPEGAVIDVVHSAGTQTWLKQGDGLFSRDGVTIKSENFVGAVNSGIVQQVGNRAGDVYVSPPRANRYVILRVDGEFFHVAWIRSGNYSGILRWSAVDIGTRRRDTPTQVDALVQQMGADILARMDQIHGPIVSEEMIAGLHNYAQRVNSSEFDEILSRFNIGRVTHHTSRVTITGTTYYYPDEFDRQSAVGDAADFTVDDVDSATIHWTRVVDIVKEGIGCTCGEIEGDDLRNYLPAEHDDYSWTYETECQD